MRVVEEREEASIEERREALGGGVAEKRRRKGVTFSSQGKNCGKVAAIENSQRKATKVLQKAVQNKPMENKVGGEKKTTLSEER